MFPRRPPINFKVFCIAAVMIVIIFAFMTCTAQAQLGGYFNNSPQRRVNRALFRVNHAGEIRLIQLVLNQAYGLYGYYDRGPRGPKAFYPVLDRNGQPLNKRQRIERATGITGISTAIGAAIDGKKGALIGAILGGSIAAINDSRYRGDQEQQAEVYFPADPLPERGGMARRPSGGMFNYPLEFEQKILQNNFNRARVRVNVVMNRTVVDTIILDPGQRLDDVQIQRGARVWGEAEIEVDEQLTWSSKIGTTQLPYHSGWVFYNRYSEKARYH